ncbi:MAG: tyrosine-type recombinase/integrase [Terriglobia bacterium]
MDEHVDVVAALIPTAGEDFPNSVSCNRVREYLERARSRNTIRGYRSSFRQFQKWCDIAGLRYMPATESTIALYLSAQAGRLRPATLEHHLAAIGKAHKAAGFPSPLQDSVLIGETLKGIKRTHGTAPKQKAPVLTEDLRIMLRLLPQNMQGARDRAILLVGFAGAFRRSELVALDVADLSFETEGLLVRLRRSKTDQEGEGRQVAIPFGLHPDTCPVGALEVWLSRADITAGPVFRPVRKGGALGSTRLTGHAIASIVKRHAKKAGLETDLFSGHSLRAGFVTSAARAGEPERRIMRQTGHKSVEMVLRYVRQANAFSDNAVKALGL